jgi:hypothetical protein
LLPPSSARSLEHPIPLLAQYATQCFSSVLQAQSLLLNGEPAGLPLLTLPVVPQHLHFFIAGQATINLHHTLF